MSVPNADNLTAHEIIDIIESVAPLRQQEGWDNSGLQVGSRETKVARVLLCTDVSDAIVEEAVAKHCQMIISHHPLLFHGLKRIEGVTRQERCVISAVKAGIVIYSSHTAMDSYLHGVSGKMADKIGISNYKILSPTSEDAGLGVIGNLPAPITVEQMLQLLSSEFQTEFIRYVVRDRADNLIHKVALCGGAGAEFMEEAIAQNADAYVTADCKYHEFQAVDGRINMFSIGHFESEQFTKEIFRDLLAGSPVECLFAENDCNFIKIYNK